MNVRSVLALAVGAMLGLMMLVVVIVLPSVDDPCEGGSVLGPSQTMLPPLGGYAPGDPRAAGASPSASASGSPAAQANPAVTATPSLAGHRHLQHFRCLRFSRRRAQGCRYGGLRWHPDLFGR
jgi:hypothetical protein